MVVLGAMIGGFVAVHFMSDPSNVDINPQTIVQLETMHIDAPNGKLLPDALFGNAVFQSPKMILILLIRTIQKLQTDQFVGGLIMAHFIFPLIF